MKKLLFKQWFKLNRENLAALREAARVEAGVNMPLEQFARQLFRQTVHYRQ